MGSKNLVQILSKFGIPLCKPAEASIIMAPPEVIEPNHFANLSSTTMISTYDWWLQYLYNIAYLSDEIDDIKKLKKSAIVEKKWITDVRIF